MLGRHFVELFGAHRRRGEQAPALHLTATTTATPQTVTIQQLTSRVDTTIDWGDGTVDPIAASYAGTLTHEYATAGTYNITYANADELTHVDIRVSQIGGLDTADLAGATLVHFRANNMGAGCVIRSADMIGWTPTYWNLYSMPAGGTYDIQSVHMAGWTPSYWNLYAMPAGGTYDIQSVHMTGWTPTEWLLYSMPAGGTYDIQSVHMTGWTPSSWNLHSMPAGGTYDIQSVHMTGWTPSSWNLYAMPAGGTYDIQSVHMTGWTPTTWYLSGMPAGGTYDIQSVHMTGWTPSSWFLYSMPEGGTYDIQSVHMTGWTPARWYLYSMPDGGTYDIQSVHMTGWTPARWYLYSMPDGGTYDIQSVHMTGWTPTTWHLYSMPEGSVTINAAANFAGFVRCNGFQARDNGLLTADVDAILYGLYQAATARTVSGGTINLGGTNQAPSGIDQAAASCPVDAATPGREVRHELLNDGCGDINLGRVWATVTVSA